MSRISKTPLHKYFSFIWIFALEINILIILTYHASFTSPCSLRVHALAFFGVVLVLAEIDIELIIFIVAGMELCFGFVLKTALIT